MLVTGESVGPDDLDDVISLLSYEQRMLLLKCAMLIQGNESDIATLLNIDLHGDHEVDFHGVVFNTGNLLIGVEDDNSSIVESGMDTRGRFNLKLASLLHCFMMIPIDLSHLSSDNVQFNTYENISKERYDFYVRVIRPFLDGYEVLTAGSRTTRKGYDLDILKIVQLKSLIEDGIIVNEDLRGEGEYESPLAQGLLVIPSKFINSTKKSGRSKKKIFYGSQNALPGSITYKPKGGLRGNPLNISEIISEKREMDLASIEI